MEYEGATFLVESLDVTAPEHVIQLVRAGKVYHQAFPNKILRSLLVTRSISNTALKLADLAHVEVLLAN